MTLDSIILDLHNYFMVNICFVDAAADDDDGVIIVHSRTVDHDSDVKHDVEHCINDMGFPENMLPQIQCCPCSNWSSGF